MTKETMINFDQFQQKLKFSDIHYRSLKPVNTTTISWDYEPWRNYRAIQNVIKVLLYVVIETHDKQAHFACKEKNIISSGRNDGHLIRDIII